MSFLDELKRRKVFRVGVVYSAGAFAVLQAADLLAAGLRMPDGVFSTVTVLVVLGFPVALVLAWLLELTPAGLRRTAPATAGGTHATPPSLLGRGTLVVSGGLVLVGLGLGAGLVLAPAAPAGESAPRDENVRTIAVLPFDDVSPDSGHEWFSDGLTEEILNRLAAVPGLRVAGRTSSFHFKGQAEDLRAIGTRLGVSHVLEGTVRRADQRLRITARLVNAEDGLHLWSDSYDRDLGDVLALQDEIARAIARELRVELGAGALPERTPSTAAYDAYLEARTLVARRGADALQRAVTLLEGTVRSDPEFAQGWASLAQAYALRAWYGGDMVASLQRAEAAASRALELDSTMVRAHVALGDVHRDRGRWIEAEASYRQALDHDPDDVEANVQYAQMLARLGHWGRAVPHAERAAELDPVSALHRGLHAYYRFEAGEREAGLTGIEEALRLDSDMRLLRDWHVIMLIDAGRTTDAAIAQEALDASAEQTFGPGLTAIRLGERLRADAGRPAEVLAYLRAEAPPERVSVRTHWQWAVHLGDPDLALAYILARHSRTDAGADRWDMSGIWSEGLAPIRALPGFARLVEELDMPRYWRRHGWPPPCRPRPDGGVECA